MPTDLAASAFPSRKALARFFRKDTRQRVHVPQLAQLLGARDEQVREMLRSEGVQPGIDSIEWGEAAGYLFDAWPRTQIIDALGTDHARLIPPAYHPTRVQWQIPLFILRAIEHQAALMRENDPRVNAAAGGRFTSTSAEDYITDILFNEIQPATVEALGHDPAFLQAYYYPPLD